jgi:hypothetical protein
MAGSYKPKVKDKVHTFAGDRVTDGYGNPQTTTFPPEVVHETSDEQAARNNPPNPYVPKGK